MAAVGAANYVSYRAQGRGGLRRDLATEADQLAVGLATPVWNIDRVQIDRVLASSEPNHSIYAVHLEAAGKTHVRIRDEAWRLAASDGPVPTAGPIDGERAGPLSGHRSRDPA